MGARIAANRYIPQLATLVRKLFSYLFRRVKFKGRTRIYRVVNRLALKLGAPPKANTRMNLGHVMIVDLRCITQVHAFYLGRYDDFFVQRFVALVDPDSVVLDVGGNIGFYSIAVARRLKELNGQGRVLVFEPYKENLAMLAESMELNGLTQWIELHPYGLSDRRRNAELVLREDFQSGSATGNASIKISEKWDRGFAKVRVPLHTLDLLAAKGAVDRADLVKVDIEGHEDCFLAGGTGLISKERPIILMEVNKPYYRARGIASLESQFSNVVPERYLKVKFDGKHWKEVATLDDCSEYENIFLVPEEKLASWHSRIRISHND